MEKRVIVWNERSCPTMVMSVPCSVVTTRMSPPSRRSISRAIHALQQTAEEAENVTVRNLEALYGDNPAAIDVAAEQAAYADADRVVFLYPTHWFNLTPMLKAYLNEVWTYGWAFGPTGTALQARRCRRW